MPCCGHVLEHRRGADPWSSKRAVWIALSPAHCMCRPFSLIVVSWCAKYAKYALASTLVNMF